MREITQRLIRRLGLNVTRACNLLENKRHLVLRRYAIKVVLDVGANRGTYARELRSGGYQGRIESFEPISWACRDLSASAARDPLWNAHHLALGSEDGSAEINVTQNQVSSSLLPVLTSSTAAEPSSAPVGVETVPVQRLDSMRSRILQPDERTYLKMDVQGYEGEVLRGAVETLRQVVAIECEMSLVPLYDRQPLAGDLLRQLAQLDYYPIWLERGFTNPHTGYMLQMDALFLRADVQP
jgi:FkbM family methyltransferase